MTDEPREENRPDEEEVEAHSLLGEPPLPEKQREKQRGEDEDDVEAHSPPVPSPPLPQPPLP
jgi:hypothetical protein